MKISFDSFELDTQAFELRQGDKSVAIEKRPFTLLVLLASNSDRVISKDEIIDKIWDGRFVGDSAIATCIKQIRKALADDGRQQGIIKTVHGVGFRFVPEARIVTPGEVAPTIAPVMAGADQPSIAVCRFELLGADETTTALGSAFPAEIISALSRLRWLLVTSRLSSFRLSGDDLDPVRVGEILNVRYCLGGSVEMVGHDLTLAMELANTRDGNVVWADRYSTTLEGLSEARSRIVAEVTEAMEHSISHHEAAASHLVLPQAYTPWNRFHLGLHYLYRFNIPDNQVATEHFQKAIELDPMFCRAHAGLSFAHWQQAFMAFETAAEDVVATSIACAERAVELDALDPFANFTLGRGHWLQGDLPKGIEYLDRATRINPNYAQGLYCTALTQVMLGQTEGALDAADKALRLSPIDPFQYAFLSVKAMLLMEEGDFDAAADMADRAARTPGAHHFIPMIAATANAKAGRAEQASQWRHQAELLRPGVTASDFFRSFPFAENTLRSTFETSLAEIGFAR